MKFRQTPARLAIYGFDTLAGDTDSRATLRSMKFDSLDFVTGKLQTIHIPELVAIERHQLIRRINHFLDGAAFVLFQRSHAVQIDVRQLRTSHHPLNIMGCMADAQPH